MMGNGSLSILLSQAEKLVFERALYLQEYQDARGFARLPER